MLPNSSKTVNTTRERDTRIELQKDFQLLLSLGIFDILSGRRESNPPHSPWEGDILPMNYARACNVGQNLQFFPNYFLSCIITKNESQSGKY